MENTRIAWLLPTAWFYWHPVLSNFAKKFPQIIVFTGLWPGFAKGFENDFSVEVVGEHKFVETSRKTAGYGTGFTYLSPKIIGKLIQFKPDLIFADSFRIWTIFALLLKPFCRWRVILAYEGSSPGVDYRNSALRLFIRRAMVKASDAYMTNSQAGRSYLVEVLGAKEERVFASPYEVPDARSLLGNPVNQTAPLAFQKPIFLFVGHLVPRKGLLLLLQACHLLCEQGYRHYTLLVVGDGEQREEAENFIREYDLHEQVELLGKLDYSCLGDYFHQADAFILPTLEDTWGMVVLEAMLFGKPALCSKWAGSSEMIRDGENGYVFDPLQPEHLRDLMIWFINNPDRISEMGEKARQTMIAHDPQLVSQNLERTVKFALTS